MRTQTWHWPYLAAAFLFLLAGGGLATAGAPPDAAGIAPLLAALLTAVDQHTPEKPPEAVAATVREYFPQASVVTVGRKSLNGLPCYNVLLRQADEDATIEVATDGSVGSIRLQAQLEDLPAAQQARVAAAVQDGAVRSLSLHLRLGVARDGTFAPLDDPDLFYAVKYQGEEGPRVANVPASAADLRAALARCGAVLPDHSR